MLSANSISGQRVQRHHSKPSQQSTFIWRWECHTHQENYKIGLEVETSGSWERSKDALKASRDCWSSLSSLGLAAEIARCGGKREAGGSTEEDCHVKVVGFTVRNNRYSGSEYLGVHCPRGILKYWSRKIALRLVCCCWPLSTSDSLKVWCKQASL